MKNLHKILISATLVSSCIFGAIYYQSRSADIAPFPEIPPAKATVKIDKDNPDILREVYIKNNLEPPECTQAGSPCMLEKVRIAKEEARKLKEDYFKRKAASDAANKARKEKIRLREIAEAKEEERIKEEFNRIYLDNERVLDFSSFKPIDFEQSSFYGLYDEFKKHVFGVSRESHLNNYLTYSIADSQIFNNGFLSAGKSNSFRFPIIFNDKIQYEAFFTNCNPEKWNHKIQTLTCKEGSIYHQTSPKISGYTVFRLSIDESMLKKINIENKKHTFVSRLYQILIVSENNEILLFNDLMKDGRSYPKYMFEGYGF